MLKTRQHEDVEKTRIKCFGLDGEGCAGPRCRKCSGKGEVYWVGGLAFPCTSRGLNDASVRHSAIRAVQGHGS